MLVEDYLKLFKNKRVMITGHTGFKGSWLTLLLHHLGADVLGYSLDPTDRNCHYEKIGINNEIKSIFSDIRNKQSIMDAVITFKPEIVFHLAAQSLVKHSYLDPISTYETNVIGGVNLLEAIRHTTSVRSLVFITSDKCYENMEWVWGYRESDSMGGIDPYSASKGAIELIFSSYHRSFFLNRDKFGAATARAGNVIGGGDWSPNRLVPDCISSINNNQPIILRNPNSTRPWQHVLEPISGYLKLAANLYDNSHAFDGSWNFGPDTSESHTVSDVVEKINMNYGNTEIIIEKSVHDKHESNLLNLNSDKARQFLKWKPRWNFQQALLHTTQWYKQVCQLNRPAREVTLDQIYLYYGDQL